MNEEKLKEILLQIVENMEALKDGINYHEHGKDGQPLSSSSVVKDKEYSDLYEQVYDNDVKDVFDEKKEEQKTSEE